MCPRTERIPHPPENALTFFKNASAFQVKRQGVFLRSENGLRTNQILTYPLLYYVMN